MYCLILVIMVAFLLPQRGLAQGNQSEEKGPTSFGGYALVIGGFFIAVGGVAALVVASNNPTVTKCQGKSDVSMQAGGCTTQNNTSDFFARGVFATSIGLGLGVWGGNIIVSAREASEGAHEEEARASIPTTELALGIAF